MKPHCLSNNANANELVSSSSAHESQVTIKHKFSLKLSVKQKYLLSYVKNPCLTRIFFYPGLQSSPPGACSTLLLILPSFWLTLSGSQVEIPGKCQIQDYVWRMQHPTHWAKYVHTCTCPHACNFLKKNKRVADIQSLSSKTWSTKTSRETWRWCLMVESNHQNLLGKFNQDWTSATLLYFFRSVE